MMNQRQLSVHLLQPGILYFQFLDTLELTHTHAAILGLPVVKGGVADA